MRTNSLLRRLTVARAGLGELQTLGPAVREWRLQRGMVLRDLAPRLGITAQYLSDLERGRRSFSLKLVMRLMEVVRDD